jgi:hypothetical protein
MPQLDDIRRRRVLSCRGAVRARRAGILGVLALLAAASGALAASAIHFYPDGLPAKLGTHMLVDFDPAAAIPRAETPDSLAVLMPHGFTVDTRAVTRECTPAQASAFRCPRQSRIGFGHVRVHFSGYLLPGGETDGVVYLTAFLGPPLVHGDPASVVLYVEWLGVDPAFQAFNRYSPTKIQPRTVRAGRIMLVRSPTYGVEISFAQLPGGLQIPPPAQAAGISARVERFKLELGAIRRVKKPIVHHEVAPTASGGTQVLTIHDHVLVPRDLFARPVACPGDGMWPWRIDVGFPEGVQALAGKVRCHP